MTDTNLIVNVSTGVGLMMGLIGIFTWLNSARKSMQAETDEKHLKVDAEVDNIQRDIADIRLAAVRAEANCVKNDDSIRHETGELGHALRTKIHEMETWNRDKFVSKETFEMVTSRIESTVEKGFERIEEQLEKAVGRLERRIDDDIKNSRDPDRAGHSPSGPRSR